MGKKYIQTLCAENKPHDKVNEQFNEINEKDPEIMEMKITQIRHK